MFTRSSQQLNAVPHQTIISTKNMNIQLKIYKVNSENYNDGCFIILLISVSCINKQKREYRHVCDSLSKMDFPPRVLDTLFSGSMETELRLILHSPMENNI